jgi:hypothetical protein
MKKPSSFRMKEAIRTKIPKVAIPARNIGFLPAEKEVNRIPLRSEIKGKRKERTCDVCCTTCNERCATLRSKRIW